MAGIREREGGENLTLLIPPNKTLSQLHGVLQ